MINEKVNIPAGKAQAYRVLAMFGFGPKYSRTISHDAIPTMPYPPPAKDTEINIHYGIIRTFIQYC